MKILIENYRGWNIHFDTDRENFNIHNDFIDREEFKKSYSSAKKWVDEYIKDNQNFKPILIHRPPNRFNNENKITLVGIRKDGRFVYLDSEGKKQQLPDYSEKDYFIYNPENDKLLAEAEELDEQINILRDKQKEVLSQFSGLSLVEYKKQLLGK